MRVLIDVKDQRQNWPRVLFQINRSVRQHSGWQSCRYGGKRYRVAGGIRNNLFISLNMPLPGKLPARFSGKK